MSNDSLKLSGAMVEISTEPTQVIERVVYKYKLENRTAIRFSTRIPMWSDMLHVGMQDGEFFLWALVETGNVPTREVVFHIFGTGMVFKNDDSLVHKATIFDGPFVWHVFQNLTKSEPNS